MVAQPVMRFNQGGLAREEALYLAASNTVASARTIPVAVPQPASNIVEGVLAVGGALMALWATHLQRSLRDLRNGSPPPGPTAPGSPSPGPTVAARQP